MNVIESVRFVLTADAARDGFVAVSDANMFSGGKATPGGPADPHMGTIISSVVCQTCLRRAGDCEGHPGLLRLPEGAPVFSPLFTQEVSWWLKSMCVRCGRLRAPRESLRALRALPVERRLQRLEKAADPRACPHCRAPVLLRFARETTRAGAIWFLLADLRRAEPAFRDLPDRLRVSPQAARMLLERVPDADVRRLGLPASSAPRNLVLTAVRVPPLPARHDFVRPDSSKKKPHDLTATLSALVRHVVKMPPVLDPPDRVVAGFEFLAQPPPDQLQQALALDELYAAFVRGGTFRPNQGGAQRVVYGVLNTLQRKEGFIRGFMLGKRVWGMGRSVIYCDPSLRLDEVAIPLSVARGLEIFERVSPDNLGRLLDYFYAAPAYPGATRLVKTSSGHDHDVEAIHARSAGIVPELGDWLVRPLLTGDLVLFNRQPSLEANSVLALRAVVKEDERSLGFGMNVLTCPFFNADFDGDEMNILSLPSADAVVEASRLSALHEWLVSYKNSRTIAGQAQDSIIGCWMLTSADTRLSKREAARLLARVSVPVDLSDLGPEDALPGRELVSRLLAASGLLVDFEGRSKWFAPQFRDFIRPAYAPSDERVVIRRGRLLSGVLDKGVVGEGAMGLFRVLAAEYGARATLEFIYNLQQVALQLATLRGFSAGLDDVLLPPAQREEVRRQVAEMRERALLAQARLRRGQLVPPLGSTVRAFNEELQKRALILGNVHEPLLQARPAAENALLAMALTGARGKLNYNIALAAVVGQMSINDQRIQPILGPRRARALYYFQNDAPEPEAYGFIVQAYVEGVDVPGFLFNSMQARVALIHKALSTAKTGWQYRKLVRSMDGVHVAHSGAVQMGPTVLQTLYGGDGVDPRALEAVELAYLARDDAGVAAEYFLDPAALSPEAAKSEAVAGALRAEREAILARRARARAAFLLQQHLDPEPSEALRGRVPLCFDPRRALGALRAERAADLRDPQTLSPRELLRMARLLGAVPELLRAQYAVPRAADVPWLVADALASELCLRRLLGRPGHQEALTPRLLEELLARLALRLGAALVPYGSCVGTLAAQAISEVLTQYVLDSHHRTAEGGTSKTGMNHVREIQGGRSKSSMPPSMYIPLHGPAAANEAQARAVAALVEMLPLERLLARTPQILFEPRPGDVRLPALAHERGWIRAALAATPAPRGLAPAVVRLELSRAQLVQKGLPAREVAVGLQRAFPGAFVLGSPEAADPLVLRVYPPLAALGGGQPHHHALRAFGQRLVAHVVRGAPGVRRAEVREATLFEPAPGGGVARVKRFYVATEGANLRHVLSDPEIRAQIEPDRVAVDCIWLTARLQGIAAARQRIIAEHTATVKGVNAVHYSLVADTMTMLGFITAIEHGGVATRDAGDALLHIANQAPQRGLRVAAMHGRACSTDSPTAAVMVGRCPTRGTHFSELAVDERFVQENAQTVSSLLL